jgi:hypothetical protein
MIQRKRPYCWIEHNGLWCAWKSWRHDQIHVESIALDQRDIRVGRKEYTGRDASAGHARIGKPVSDKRIRPAAVTYINVIE